MTQVYDKGDFLGLTSKLNLVFTHHQRQQLRMYKTG